ncbi:hypothetical protein [Terrarubrum flagellatum]|uniref:hypothetical protein n=1 Tax=Terrirubrum flagellatum TaxID=2895980 RepID=UPI003145545B
MDPRRNRGPVIERANEPGLPRGLVRIVVVVALGWLAYATGYLPDTSSIERGWTEVSSEVEKMWASATSPSTPTPAPSRPTQTSSVRPPSPPISVPSPPVAQPTTAPPPSKSDKDFADFMAFTRRMTGMNNQPGAKPPEPPAAPASDPFADSFKRDVLGQLPAKPPASGDVASASPPPQSARPTPSPSAPTPPASPAPDATRTSLFPRPPGTPAAPFPADAVDKFVSQQLDLFNASRDVPAKRVAMEKIMAAAEIGHGPSRGVIVRGFPASTIIRDVVPASDVVRFALDFIVQKRAYSNDARRDFVALAQWLDGDGRSTLVGEAVFEAMRDDSRLQSPDALNDLMSLLSRTDRGCAALSRHLGGGDAACSRELATAAVERAKQAGAGGVDARRFRDGVDTLRKSLGDPT